MKQTKLKGLEKPRDGGIDLQEEVRRRAYQIYEQRGMADGFELEDWCQAESEILDARRSSQRAA